MKTENDLQKIVDHAKNLDMDFVKFTEWVNESSVFKDDKDTLISLFEQDGVRKVDFVDGITDKDIIPDRTPPEDDVEEMSGDMAYRAMDKAEKKSRGEMSVTNPEKAKKKAKQAQKFADYSIKKTLNKEEVEIEEGAKFSASQINKLKTEYSKLQKIDPESPDYKKMKAALGKMSKEQLKQIKDAKIKFMQFTAGDLLRKMGEEVTDEVVDKYESMYISRIVKNKVEVAKLNEENRGPRTDAEKKAHLDKIFKHIDNVRKKKEAKLGFKITDVTPKGYGPTDEEHEYDGKVVKISKKDFTRVHRDFKNTTKGQERMMVNDPKTGGSVSAPVQFTEETNLERLKKTLAIHKFKKSGGKIEKQPEGDAYNAMKWRGKTQSTRDEDQEDERARNVMAYRKTLRARKKAKKKQ